MRPSPQSLAGPTSRHPWRTVGMWALAVVGAGALSSALLGGAVTTKADLTNNPESKQALALVEQRLKGPDRDTEIVVVRSTSASVDDPGYRRYVEELQRALSALGPDVVQQTATYFQTNDESMVSRDRRTTVVPTVVAGPPEDAADHLPALEKVFAATDGEGFEVLVFGPAALGDDFNTVSEEDLRTGESVGVLAALVILVVVFGALLAGIIPIVIGVASIAVAVGIVAVVGQAFSFSFFVTNMITMMGLAVGIDYSLFVVSRYREERQRGRDKLAAIEATGATASRAVFFTGMTVVLALLGMIIIPNSIFRSLGAGAIFVVLVAVLASLTLLPAVLALLGEKVKEPRIRRRAAAARERRGGFWDRVTRGVMRRPVVSLAAGVLLLLAAASSALDMQTGFSGVSTLSDDFESKKAFDVLAQEFSGGLSSPVEIAVDGNVQARPLRAASSACGHRWRRTASSVPPRWR